MELKARSVLNDAWEAIHELELGEDGWKSFWITAVSRLRSVSDVLKNIDAKQSVTAATVLTERFYSDWQPEDDDPTWFTEFIKPVRDGILHEDIGIPTRKIQMYGNEESGPVFHVTLTLEFGEGEEAWEDDGLHLLNEAAKWVESELDYIEQEIESRESS